VSTSAEIAVERSERQGGICNDRGGADEISFLPAGPSLSLIQLSTAVPFWNRTIRCATCQSLISAKEATTYIAEQMAELADNGFGLSVPTLQDQPRERHGELFKQFVENHRVAWRLCPACVELAKPYWARPATPPPVTTAPAADAMTGKGSRSNVLSLVLASTLALPRMLFALARKLVSYSLVRGLLFVCAVLVAALLYRIAETTYDPTRWWWQSRTAFALSSERAKADDWQAVRRILQNALGEYPDNPPLIRRAANAELLLDRHDMAAMHYQQLSTIMSLPELERERLYKRALSIGHEMRARAATIAREVFRLEATLPNAMRISDGPPFHPLEALVQPPVTVQANMTPSYKLESYDGTQVICMGVDPNRANCSWSFAKIPWIEIIRTRRIRVDYPRKDDPTRCCEINLDDPELASPAGALQSISRLPPGHQLRAMFRLASKIAFIANTIVNNDRRRPGFAR
jgi:hypothetical protein